MVYLKRCAKWLRNAPVLVLLFVTPGCCTTPGLESAHGPGGASVYELKPTAFGDPSALAGIPSTPCGACKAR